MRPLPGRCGTMGNLLRCWCARRVVGNMDSLAGSFNSTENTCDKKAAYP